VLGHLGHPRHSPRVGPGLGRTGPLGAVYPARIHAPNRPMDRRSASGTTGEYPAVSWRQAPQYGPGFRLCPIRPIAGHMALKNPRPATDQQ